ncbi:MAG: anti-CBASS Acb1 family protein [bacterium]
MKEVHAQIVGPNGQPVRSAPVGELSNAQLRERVGLLRESLAQRRGQMENSLEGLAAALSQGQGQDNITSMTPMFTSNIYAPLTVNFTLLSYLFKTHGIIRTLIVEPIEDAWRGGLELMSKELGEEGIGELEDFLEEKGIWESVRFGQRWTRLFGGGGLVINSGQDDEKPLDPQDLKKGNLELYDADRWEFSGASRSAPSFLFYGHKLDASRVLTLSGERAPRLLRATLNGWGFSAIESVVEDFNVWLRGRNVLYAILDEAKVDVYAIKGFASTLAVPGGLQTLTSRVQATNQIKNFQNALLLDSEDDYKVVTNSFSGLADVMRENRIGISCATRMPFSKLFGTTAGSGGLSNSGEDDMENYNAMITSRVRSPARPIIRKMLRLMMFAVWGREYDIAFEFKPLRILSAKDQEDIDDKKQSRFERLYDKRILDSKELGELLHKHKLISIQTKAQQGLLPMNPEVPTTEQMFADKPEGGESDGAGKGDGDGKRDDAGGDA